MADMIEYQGPDREFKPQIGSVISAASTDTFPTAQGQGYYDVNYLKTLLAKNKTYADNLISQCEDELEGFALIIPPDSDLQKAQASEYVRAIPDASSIPAHVDYVEYKYLEAQGKTNASDFIVQSYESKVRDIDGTNALDVLQITQLINDETQLVQEFLNEYLGDIDDPAEFRTLELFQNWAEDAETFLSQIQGIYVQKLQSQSAISSAQLDSFDQDTAVQYQTLFKTNVNRTNQDIVDTVEQFKKSFSNYSKVFYNKYLGPSLRFRLGVSRNLDNGVSGSLLSNQVNDSVASANSNFAVMLSDQTKRNAMFKSAMHDLINRIVVRDQYVANIRQLQARGKSIKKVMTSVDISQEHRDAFQVQPADTSTPLLKQGSDLTDQFSNAHNLIDGREVDDAHPQYLLRSGGNVITGDVEVADGIKVGGIVLNKHRHNGIDGSEKIHGEDIIAGTLQVDVIDGDGSTISLPANLRIISQSVTVIGSSTLVAIQVAFDMDSTTGISNYEIEISPLD